VGVFERIQVVPSTMAGFETDVHGLVKKVEDGKAIYYVDCVEQ
jgi:hypothetical protein